MARRIAAWIQGLILVGAGTAMAHHSSAMFDRTREIELVGVVKEYQFANPHVWIEIGVTGEDGQPKQWSIEGEGPAMMARMGLGPAVLKVGDKVTMRIHPLRDGRTGGSFILVTLPDGKIVSSLRPPL